MTTLAIIDFGSLFGVRYHANGDDAAAARNECIGYVRDALYRHDVVAVAIDSPPYRRKDRFPGYKAQREPWPAGAMELKKATIEEIAPLCHVLGAPGYEADDIIATVANVAAGADLRIYSADKDLAQLAGRASVFKLDGTPHDLGGLAPELVADYLAILGDASDNLPGIDGIGKTKARVLLDAFGNLDGLHAASAAAIQDLPGFGPGVAGKLLAAWDVPPGELTPHDVRDLIRLETDAPIDCSVLTIPTRPKEETMTDETAVPPAEDTQPSSRESGAVEVEVEPVSSGPRPTEKTSIVMRRPDSVVYERALEPYDLNELWRIAKVLCDSGLFKNATSPARATAVILAGRQLGLTAAQSLQHVNVIAGKMELDSHLLRGLCQAHPDCEYFMVTDMNDDGATVETMRRGYPRPFKFTYTRAMAERAGLTSNANYKKNPHNMFAARATSTAAKMMFADIVGGCYVTGEIQEAM